jgi:hypothetical protein
MKVRFIYCSHGEKTSGWMPTSHRLPQEQVTPDANIRGKEASQIKDFFFEKHKSN